jgi:hypothetical protein
MIHAFGNPDPPVSRLVEALGRRGHALERSSTPRPTGQATLLLGPGLDLDPMAAGVLLGAWRTTPGARVLVLSLLGAHRDSRVARLRALWEIEERARGSGMPSLVLRLGPMVGPRSPLWLRLRARPRLGRREHARLNPVIEDDAVETIDRALRGDARWEGWYEVAGEDVWTLGELVELASARGERLPARAGAWEPPLDEMGEHRLAETSAWRNHFRLTPVSVRSGAAAWPL